ncbi:hypothetical protein [Schlesneria sp.]|uniref:hypothetical protein n=1 Tax=Schlesneria sp. TaxID=2762018 RepID=UPI002EE53CFD
MYYLWLVRCLLALISVGFSSPSIAAPPVVEFGPLTELRTDEGRISFGMIVSADVVSWSSPDSRDLLIGRLWDGVYLYPSQDLQSFGEPIRLCDQLGHVVLMVEPWGRNAEGYELLIGCDRLGNVSLLRKAGQYPDIRLEVAQKPLMMSDGSPLNIPFVNPKYRLSSNPEQLWPQDFNYTYPTVYRSLDGGEGVIFGDWGGELWFMPHTGNEGHEPAFAGRLYNKRDGRPFARPRHLLKDEQGETLLMGTAAENGIRYPGGAARPVMYRNEVTGSHGLLVVGGMERNQIHFLQQVKTGAENEPIFQDHGEVTIEGLPDEGYDPYNYHAVLTLVETAGGPDLLLSRGCDIAYYKHLSSEGVKPRFRFDYWLSGKNVPTRGYNFTEILTDHRGRRFLLENDTFWTFRQITTVQGEPKLSSTSFPLLDQNGIFLVEGETDMQHLEKWGFHRAALWNYDGSGQQHLIVGTDKGLLYLLRLEKDLGVDNRFEFRSFGPLKDSHGEVIRLHHRVVAAPVDLNGDGRLDLVLAGATYGSGDPRPGSGIYCVLNEGELEDQSPVLSPAQVIETVGHVHPDFKMHHGQVQSLDLFGTGEKLVVVSTQIGDDFRGYVYRPSKDRIALEHTGVILPPISIEERLLDLKGDGKWQYVRSGGESLIAKYSTVRIRASTD